MNVCGTFPQAGANTQGTLNYLSASATSSLYRNGKVMIRRDSNGSDSAAKGVDIDGHILPIADARSLEGTQARSLSANGFELIDCPLAKNTIDFFDQTQVIGRYYDHCVHAVEAATGAKAYAFDHNVRSATGKNSKQKIKGGQEVQGPAHVVHGDYTLTSAPQRLRDLANPPALNDTYRPLLAEGHSLIDDALVNRVFAESGRFAIINLWRNIAPEPVATHPMAFCDGQTVVPDDLVVFEIHYADRVGENYFAKHAADHGWYYYPQVTPDEAILIKQWDSAGTMAATDGAASDASEPTAPCSFSFHSAFEDPNTPDDAPDRWSIEVRCLVVYD